MRDDTSAPEPQAHGLPYQIEASSNHHFALHFNAKAAALQTYQLELQASGQIALLPAFSAVLLFMMSGQIDPARLPRMLARVSGGWLAEETGKALGHTRRALFHLKRLGFIAVIDTGGGSEESLYELLPVSAQARTVSAQARRARKRAISAQSRVYKAQARTGTGRACAPGEGDTLDKNVVVVDTYTNNTTSTPKTPTREDLEKSVVVGALEEFGIWPDVVAELVQLPTTNLELARAAMIQAKGKGIDNPPVIAASLLRNPERIHARNVSKAKAQLSAAAMSPATPPAPRPVDEAALKEIARIGREALAKAKAGES